MDVNPVLVGVNQPNLSSIPAAHYFALDERSEFWRDAQDLIHPDIEVRQSGFNRLINTGAVSQSPLLSYLLVSRLAEPDLGLRAQIIGELYKILSLPFNGNPLINEVLYFLKSSLSQLRHNQIQAVLQMVEAKPETYSQAARIISQCSYAGDHLVEVVSDRRASLGLRQVAARLVGDIGYIKSIPAMERIEARLESRINTSSTFTHRPNLEADLLPTVKEALSILRS